MLLMRWNLMFNYLVKVVKDKLIKFNSFFLFFSRIVMWFLWSVLGDMWCVILKLMDDLSLFICYVMLVKFIVCDLNWLLF